MMKIKTPGVDWITTSPCHGFLKTLMLNNYQKTVSDLFISSQINYPAGVISGKNYQNLVKQHIK